jgi:hypothetical protein
LSLRKKVLAQRIGFIHQDMVRGFFVSDSETVRNGELESLVIDQESLCAAIQIRD